MKQFEAMLLLAKAATFDNRKELGDETAASWAQALGDVRLEDALLAVVEYYTHTRWPIMPSDILDGVRTIRTGRIRAVMGGAEPMPPPEIPADDVDAYQAWRKTFTRALGDGAGLIGAETVACEAAGIPVVHRAITAHQTPQLTRSDTE